MLKTILMLLVLGLSGSTFAQEYACSIQVKGTLDAGETSAKWNISSISLDLTKGGYSFVIWQKPIFNEKREIIGHALNPCSSGLYCRNSLISLILA